MLRIHFTGPDLSRVTVATEADPLWEVLFSLHDLQQRYYNPLVLGEWRRRTMAARPTRVRLLLELAPPVGYSPDFLTPGRGEADLATLMDRLLCTPRQRLREDLTYLARQQSATPWTRSLAHGDRDALRQLHSTLAAYHRVGIAPYRAQIRTQIQADVDRRGQTLLGGGVDRLLATLHPRVRWDPPVLRVLNYVDRDLYLHGRGLVLVPSLFLAGFNPITLKDSDGTPVLVYSITPVPGWLNPTNLTDATDPVAGLLGPTRATCLHACADPCTTTDLARRTGISLSAASRQATVLRQAGLITTRRDGGTVLHQITGLGIAVLNGHLPSDPPP
jgi:DNA-binding transcriptional ArsR family regulator